MTSPADTSGTASTIFVPTETDLAESSQAVSAELATPLVPPGEVLNGRYVVRRLLGEGGMGIVYQVRDLLHPDRPLALKTIRRQTLSASRLELFKSEFQTMAKLRHPHVARVYDFEPLHGTPDHFFTMEYVDGQNIFRATAEVTWREVLEVVVQICRALAYIHSRRVTHYDLKPTNVLVTPAGQVKVLDFGLAGTRAGWIVGTPRYMAPEQLAHGSADHRADLYSLGVLTYVLLCRRHPRDESLDATTVTPQPNAEVQWGPVELDAREHADVPAWLAALVARLCARDPADRYPSANAVIEAINAEGGLAFAVETPETLESYVLSSRFVGREAERECLIDYVLTRLHPREAPTPPLALVAGESGIGKSRLLHELRIHFQLGRIPVVEISIFEGSPGELAPVEELLGHLVRLADATGNEALVARYGPDLARLCPALGPQRGLRAASPSGAPELDQRRLDGRVAEFLLSLAGTVPYLLCLHDLQWARPGSLRLLGRLVQQLGAREDAGERIRLAVVANYRSAEARNPALERLLAQTAGNRLQLDLAPLDRGHLAALVSSMLGVDSLPVEFVDRVTEETTGNPYFVEELMRTLVEQGALTHRQGQWSGLSAVAKLDVPQTVLETFLRRMAFLPGDARELLELLATAGQPLELSALEHAAGRSGPPLHAALRALTRRRMARLLPGADLSFCVRHDRLREALYAQLDGPRRRALHGRIGAALEALHGPDADEHLHTLAHHFRRAGDPQRGLRYSLVAGERARTQYANEVAIECFDYACARLEAWDPRRAELLEKLGDCHTLQGSYVDAMACYREATHLTTDPLGPARLGRKIGEVHIQNDELQRALEALWDAVRQLGEDRPTRPLAALGVTVGSVATHLIRRLHPVLQAHEAHPAERARLAELTTCYLRLCYVYYFVRPEAAVLPQLRAYGHAARLGPSPELCHCSSQLAQLYALSSLFGSADTFAHQALEMATDLGSDWHLGVARCRLGMIAYFRSRWSEGLEHLTAAQQIFARCGDLFELGASSTHVFACQLNQGRLRQAARTAERVGRLLGETGDTHFGERGARTQALYTHAKLGDVGLDEACATLEREAEAARAARDLMACSVFWLWLGDLHRIRDDTARAVEALHESIRVRESTMVRLDYDVAAYPKLALAYLDRIREAPRPARLEALTLRLRAGRLVQKALGLTRRRNPNYRSQALLAQAVLQHAGLRPGRARRLFAESRAVAERQHARAWLADGYLEEARCLLADGGGPPGRAGHCLRRALEIYGECELAPEHRRAQALLDSLARVR